MVATVLIAAAFLSERAAAEQFVADLGKLRAEAQFLRVTFTLERTDAVMRRTDTFDGTLAVARDATGGAFGALRFIPKGRAGAGAGEVWVLRGDDIFHYDEAARTIRKCRSAEVGPLRYVAESVWGAAWLLDPREACKRCQVKLLKRDSNYDYFAVAVEETPLWPLFGAGPGRAIRSEYRVAVVRRDTLDFPKGAIRSFARVLPNGDAERFTVSAWVRDGRLTAADLPDPDAPPEGWKRIDPAPDLRSRFEQEQEPNP